MACQTGIRGDEQLFDFFEHCKKCKVRFGKIVINNEKLTVNFQYKPSKDWRHDWKKCMPEKVDSFEPCFLLFRFDSSHDWILITFADDKASIKDKMLLAATKATFKSEFGQSFIRAEYHVSNKNDLILETFERRHLHGHSAVNETADSEPLSFVERELATVVLDRASAGMPLVTQSVRGIQFPVDQNALEKIREFGKGEIDFVQLSIDTLNEAIKLENTRETALASELGSLINKHKPRYSFFRLSEADSRPVFFIYSIPPTQACTIKELMLYSSCKSPFLSEVQNDLGVKISKKIEIDSKEKLDTQSLLSYLDVEPVAATPSPKFDRPQRPGRGPTGLVAVPKS